MVVCDCRCHQTNEQSNCGLCNNTGIKLAVYPDPNPVNMQPIAARPIYPKGATVLPSVIK